jgi:RNA polymerase sigma-70 factor (ECF subfamily)
MVAALATQRSTIGEAERRRAPERRESQLVRAAQRGSEAALEELFNRHWPPSLRLAYLIVHDAAAAEDIAQEGFLAAVGALDRFDRRRPFAPWLHRIVANRAIDWARARALRRETGVGEAEAGPAPDPDPGYPDELVAALRGLSLDRRTAIVLRYLLDYTPGEIARLLGVPRGTVNSRLRRGLDELAAVVESEE